VLPAITLGASTAGKLARFVRTSVLDIIGQPFIRTARGKALPPLRIILHHVFPNAAIPIVTFLGFETGLVIGGAVVTESVFGWPGVGRLLVESVAKRDLAVVQAIIFLIALAIMITNLLVDLAYGWLDPRIRVIGRRNE
jgi:peptide/nickel transport system permease protein